MKLVSRMSGGLVGDGLALVAALLAGVAPDAEGLLPAGVSVKELVEFLQLAVGQRVHRVDDNGSRAWRGVGLLGLEDAVNDWMKKDSDFPEPVPVVTT
jgi:hypothetical protein